MLTALKVIILFRHKIKMFFSYSKLSSGKFLKMFLNSELFNKSRKLAFIKSVFELKNKLTQFDFTTRFTNVTENKIFES